MHVYQQAIDEQVRQRALVGWVFSMDAELDSIFPEETELLKTLLDDEQCRQELVDLQKQIIYCINVEQDQATIRDEIMPDLIKTKKNQDSPIIIDWNNEEDQDPLNDILHPNEAEERLEKMENSYRKMIDMQKQGSDIYFGGFSQMKRFPFFNEIVNWLMPFDMNHPDIQSAAGRFKENRFL